MGTDAANGVLRLVDGHLRLFWDPTDSLPLYRPCSSSEPVRSPGVMSSERSPFTSSGAKATCVIPDQSMLAMAVHKARPRFAAAVRAALARRL